MDAPNGHSTIKAKSVETAPAARVTIAVLVNCTREPQHFLNLDVAKSAAAAPTWRGHQAQSVDGSGNVHSKIPVSKAAKMVQPSNYTGPNVALEALFHMWDSFHTSKTMWRPNPEMRQGDATPEGCIRTFLVAQLSKQWPVHSVPPTRPLNPKQLPAAPHVDKAGFLKLHPSFNERIGGIQGSKDFQQGTFKGSRLLRSPMTAQPCLALPQARLLPRPPP